MVSLAARVGMWLYRRRFKGKGDSNLRRLARLTPDRDSWVARTRVIREGILAGAGLSPFPRKTPPNPVIHSAREHDGYIVESMFFESIPGFLVTGSLYSPADRQTKGARFPAVLKPHGHFKDGRFRPDNQHFCANMARLGAVVFTWDMVGYCDSTQVETHKIPRAFTLQLLNSIRSIDLVANLPMVDPGRIAITGTSGGGTQTFMATAVDDRIAVSAPSLMVSANFFGGCVCESGLPVHRGKGYATNNAEIAAMAAPRPMLLVSIDGDWTRWTPQVEFPFIQRIYQLFDAGENVENVHVKGEKHDLGPTKRAAIYEFLARRLGLPPKGSDEFEAAIDDSRNEIEPVETMTVFNDEHPRPSNLLTGEHEIIQKIIELQSLEP